MVYRKKMKRYEKLKKIKNISIFEKPLFIFTKYQFLKNEK